MDLPESERRTSISSYQEFILVIIVLRLTRLDGNGVTCFSHQLRRLLIQANHRSFRIMRTLMNLQDIFHACVKPGVLPWRDHPARAQMWLEFFFFAPA